MRTNCQLEERQTSAVRQTKTWARSSGVVQCHLEIYFKFLFVRNPFETLISAYKDKFVETPDVHYMERCANKIVDNLKHYTDPSSGNELTFKKVI